MRLAVQFIMSLEVLILQVNFLSKQYNSDGNSVCELFELLDSTKTSLKKPL